MSEFAITILKFSYLILLWGFIFALVALLKLDLFSRIRRKPVIDAKRIGETREFETISEAKDTNEYLDRKVKGIEVVSGIAKGDFISLENAANEFAITFGRDIAATIRLDDPSVSSLHARLFGERGHLYVEDLGSTNGTIVDNQAITSPVRVVNGSLIRIGKNIMEVRL